MSKILFYFLLIFLAFGFVEVRSQAVVDSVEVVPEDTLVSEEAEDSVIIVGIDTLEEEGVRVVATETAPVIVPDTLSEDTTVYPEEQTESESEEEGVEESSEPPSSQQENKDIQAIDQKINDLETEILELRTDAELVNKKKQKDKILAKLAKLEQQLESKKAERALILGNAEAAEPEASTEELEESNIEEEITEEEIPEPEESNIEEEITEGEIPEPEEPVEIEETDLEMPVDQVEEAEETESVSEAELQDEEVPLETEPSNEAEPYIAASLLDTTVVDTLASQDTTSLYIERMLNLHKEAKECSKYIEVVLNSEQDISVNGPNVTRDHAGAYIASFMEYEHKSFWYKIIVNFDCQISCSIYPSLDIDIYNFFVYKDSANTDFCSDLLEFHLLPMRTILLREKMSKTGVGLSVDADVVYSQTPAENVDVLFHTPYHNALSAKAGDVYYLNVFHTDGKECDHTFTINAGSGKAIIQTYHDDCTNDPVEKMIRFFERKKEAERREREQAARDSLALVYQAEADSLAKIDSLREAPQLQLTGQVLYRKDPGKVAEGVLVIIKAEDGKRRLFRKSETNVEATFRFDNLDKYKNFIIYFDENDPNIQMELEPYITGVVTSGGEPVVDVLINDKDPTAEDGTFSAENIQVEKHDYSQLTPYVKEQKVQLTADAKEQKERPGAVTTTTQSTAVMAEPEVTSVPVRIGTKLVEHKVGKKYAGLTYKVQIGAYYRMNDFDYSPLTGLGDVEYKKYEDNLIRFMMGSFGSRAQAEVLRQKVILRGIEDAFIVVFASEEGAVGASVVSDSGASSTGASTKSSEYVSQGKSEEVVSGVDVAVAEPAPTPTTPQQGVFYKVQVGAYSRAEDANFDNLSGLGQIESKTGNDGLIRFTIGNFTSIEQARALKNQAVSRGADDAFIVKFVDGKRYLMWE